MLDMWRYNQIIVLYLQKNQIYQSIIMGNLIKKNKFIVAFGRIINFLFLTSLLCRLFFRKEYVKEMHNDVTLILMIFFGLYAIINIRYQLKYNKENFISNIKIGLQKSWPQLFFITSLLLIWFLYRRNLG